jgi:2',3'-cyclic-nucleotide 2'-phosphodiesterase (5'-nucleotidase family)
MNELAPDVSLVGEIVLGNFQRVNTQYVALGNHDFDFGMHMRPYFVLQLLKKAQDTHIYVH